MPNVCRRENISKKDQHQKKLPGFVMFYGVM